MKENNMISSNYTVFEYEKFYHIYNRGNAGEHIFKCEGNFHYFLEKYSQHINPVADTFAYCLMPNHFHFLIRIKSEEELQGFIVNQNQQLNPQGFENLAGLITKQFEKFLSAYTKTFNKQENRSGSLFGKPFKKKKINSDDLTHMIYYIHNNPVQQDFVKSLEDWPHSSYHTILSNRNTKLQRGEIVKCFGGREEFKSFHKNYHRKNALPEINKFFSYEGIHQQRNHYRMG
ncbi:MAG: hypothetical protein K2X86_15655 [Cytophagaceae bacterium]|nr:hypothetical protein [Cytophagaceae bacterium]